MKQEMDRRVGIIEEKKIVEDMEEIENSKDDSTRMYKAIRIQQRNKPKDEIMVDGDEGLTASGEEATKIVTEFFKKTFNAENQRKFETVPPKQMSTPFTKEEVNKAIKSLKNNKSAGVDDTVA